MRRSPPGARDALVASADGDGQDGTHELFALARGLSDQPLPKGKRVGIITNAGGPAILCNSGYVLLGRIIEVPDNHLGASRREFFDTIDRPALMPLPAEPYDLDPELVNAADKPSGCVARPAPTGSVASNASRTTSGVTP